jgi:hypothetical protein
LTDSLRESKDTLNYISFESQGDLRGIENLKPILFAIKNHRKVVFAHENFDTGKQRKYTVEPYLLKEYQTRWYLVGIILGTNDVGTSPGVPSIATSTDSAVVSEDVRDIPEVIVDPAPIFEDDGTPTEVILAP